VPDFCEEGPIATRQSVVVRLGLFGWWRSGEAAVGAWNAFSLEFEFDSMNVFAWVRCLIVLRVGTRTVLSHDIYLVEATRRRVDLINTPASKQSNRHFFGSCTANSVTDEIWIITVGLDCRG
jgi:hypothetical protein